MRWIAVAVVFGLLANSQAVCAQAPSNDEVVTTFATVALGSTSGSVTDEPKLTRWTVPVRIALIGMPAPEPALALIRSHTERLKAITGHDIQLAANGAGNVSIVWADEPFTDIQNEPYRTQLATFFQRDASLVTMIGMARGSAPCYALTLRNSAERPYAALVGISVKSSAEEQRACVIKQLTKVMGLLGTSNSSWSVTAAGFRHLDLPPGDVRMLKLLYHARLSQGMGLGEVRKLAPELVKELTAAE